MRYVNVVSFSLSKYLSVLTHFSFCDGEDKMPYKSESLASLLLRSPVLLGEIR